MLKRAIIYTTVPNVGGSSVVCLSLTRLLGKLGFSVEVWALEPTYEVTNIELIETFAKSGVRVRRVPSIAKGVARFVDQCYFILKALLTPRDIDLFVVIGMDRASEPLCSALQAKRSLYFCQNDSSEAKFLSRLTSLIRWFDIVVLIANNTRTRLESRLKPYEMAKVATIPQFTEFQYQREIVSLQHVHRAMQVTFMGALKPHKGIVELASSWVNQGPQGCELHIYGDGPQRSIIEALCNQVAVNVHGQNTKRVVYHGSFQVAKRNYALSTILGSTDLLVLPTLTDGEGLPTVILEALCVGIPIVATRYGGVISFSKRYYPDIPKGIRICDSKSLMGNIVEAVNEIKSGSVDRNEIRKFYCKHFSNAVVEEKWRKVILNPSRPQIL